MTVTQSSIESKRSLRRGQEQNLSKSQGFDSCQTPRYAIEPLLKYLKPIWYIWESAAGEGNLVEALCQREFTVISTDILTGSNFFNFEPERWNCQITNPPYSIKLQWLERSYQLGKPFALLLPVETLGVGAAQKMFKKNGIEVILLNKRVDFKTINTDFKNSTSWFPTAWFTNGLNIGKMLTFESIIKRPDEQIKMELVA